MKPKHFGRYLIVEEIGRGAMGTVYRAVDPLIERSVAIKTLLPNLPEEALASVKARFVREAKSAGKLNHPNIVTVYDVGEQDGVAYMAMELLEGRTLQEILRDETRMPVATIADIMAQVADALDHARHYGIVHRDVKPANIVISASGRAKLADFGIAHLPTSAMTQDGAALGSPKYMSPEQVLDQRVDPSSDIFSLGVVLYEALMGVTPFEGRDDGSVYAIMRRIPAEPHGPIAGYEPAIARAFDQILARALAKSPSARYERAGHMANDLRNFNALTLPGQSGTPARVPPPFPVAGTPGVEEPAPEETMFRMPELNLPSPAKAAPKASVELLADIEQFSQDFEQQDKERTRVEEETRRRKAEALRKWSETERRHREEFDRQREAEESASPGGARTSVAIELLRKRGAAKAPAEKKENKAEIHARIDARLRAAFKYLTEFSAELNAVHPVSERPYAVMYLGEIAGVALSDAFTDYRSRNLGPREVFDNVTFKYKVRSQSPVKVNLAGPEYLKARERLDAMRIAYRSAERKNDFGQVVKGALALAGPFPCQAVLRGDYEADGFVLELTNVRRYGVEKLRLASDDLTDGALDELGTYILGVEDAFERRRKHGA